MFGAATPPAEALVPKQRADAAHRLEVAPVADHVHGAAVGERLVDGADEDDAHAAQLPDGCVQRVRDPAEMLADEVLDVAAVARLRPAALVVLPRRLLGVVGQLDELAAAQAVDLAPLAPDERDENAL